MQKLIDALKDSRIGRAYHYTKKDLEIGLKRLKSVDDAIIESGGIEAFFTKNVRRPIIYPLLTPIVTAAIYLRNLYYDQSPNR